MSRKVPKFFFFNTISLTMVVGWLNFPENALRKLIPRCMPLESHIHTAIQRPILQQPTQHS